MIFVGFKRVSYLDKKLDYLGFIWQEFVTAFYAYTWNLDVLGKTCDIFQMWTLGINGTFCHQKMPLIIQTWHFLTNIMVCFKMIKLALLKTCDLQISE